MAVEGPVFSDLSGYVNRVAKLLRLDAALLRIETKENLQAAVIAVGLLAAALAVAFLGAVILLFAIVMLLIQLGLSATLAAFAVACRAFRRCWPIGPHRDPAA